MVGYPIHIQQLMFNIKCVVFLNFDFFKIIFLCFF
jgi:hypothetical protein